MPTIEIPGLPRAIYIETSILRKLPLHIVEAEMERLLANAQYLDSLVLVPESCLLEWLPHRKKLLEGMTKRINDGFSGMIQTFGYAPDPKWSDEARRMLAELDTTTKNILERHGIALAPLITPDVRALFARAVAKIRPFEEEGEKGFRDTVNLYSILEHAKALTHTDPGFDCIVLIAEDDGFNHVDVQALAKEYGWNLYTARFGVQLHRRICAWIDAVCERLRA